MTISNREKDETQPIVFDVVTNIIYIYVCIYVFIVYIYIYIYINVYIYIYHAVTIENSKRKNVTYFSFLFPQVMKIKEVF